MKIGSRVKYSQIGMRDLRKQKPNREGTIVGSSRTPKCHRVHWDDTATKSNDCIHQDFLEEIEVALSSHKDPT